jgi:hypothetical protein
MISITVLLCKKIHPEKPPKSPGGGLEYIIYGL